MGTRAQSSQRVKILEQVSLVLVTQDILEMESFVWIWMNVNSWILVTNLHRVKIPQAATFVLAMMDSLVMELIVQDKSRVLYWSWTESIWWMLMGILWIIRWL